MYRTHEMYCVATKHLAKPLYFEATMYLLFQQHWLCREKEQQCSAVPSVAAGIKILAAATFRGCSELFQECAEVLYMYGLPVKAMLKYT